jgi:NTE family protein
MDVMGRRDSAEQAVLSDFRKLVEDILARVTSAQQAELIRQWPRHTQLMGDDEARLDILRITREGAEGEPASKDYDFSATSIRQHIEAGYATAQQALRSRATG